MGLFDKDKEKTREEVRVNVPNESKVKTSGSESGRGRLKSEVESKVTDSSKGGSSKGSGSVDLNDIYEQNQRIIELLENISDKGSNSKDKKQKSKTEVGSGMDELL